MPPGYGMPYVGAPLSNRADLSGHKPGLRTWFLVCSIGGAACFLIAPFLFLLGAITGDPDALAVMGVLAYIFFIMASPFIIAKIVLAMVWLHGAWKWLPPDRRFDKSGQPMGPDKVFYLFIPYFHYYWMFPINSQLCYAMDRMRAERFPQTATTSNPDMAMWGAICEFIPFVNVFVAPFLWASHMKRIDQMHEEMQALGA